MGLPAFTIHSIVKYSGKALKDAKNVKIRSYGPIGVSLISCEQAALGLLIQFSSVWLLYLPCHSCLTSQSSMPSSSSSTRASSSLEDLKQLDIGQQLGAESYGRPKRRLESRRRRNCECTFALRTYLRR